MLFIFCLFAFFSANASLEITIPGAATETVHEEQLTPRPVGIEFMLTKIGRIERKMNVLEEALKANPFNWQHCKNLFNNLKRLIKRVNGYMPQNTINRFKNLEVAMEALEKKFKNGTCLGCVIL